MSYLISKWWTQREQSGAFFCLFAIQSAGRDLSTVWNTVGLLFTNTGSSATIYLAEEQTLSFNGNLFFTYNISRKKRIFSSKWYMTIVSKSTIWYLTSFRYDIWLSFWNERKNMTIFFVWLRLRQSANQSAGAENFWG